MYSMAHHSQVEAARRHIFGSRTPRDIDYTDPRDPGATAHVRYSLPPGVKVLECVQDINGEFVPKPDQTPDSS